MGKGQVKAKSMPCGGSLNWVKIGAATASLETLDENLTKTISILQDLNEDEFELVMLSFAEKSPIARRLARRLRIVHDLMSEVSFLKDTLQLSYLWADLQSALRREKLH